MNLLILIRGLPGSGKSTIAQHLTQYVIDDDDFYTKDDGTYNFTCDMIEPCHAWMLSYCEYLMSTGGDISITSPLISEVRINRFMDLANKYSYEFHSIIKENRHIGTSIHNVPDDQLNEMKRKFDIRL